MKDYKKKVTVYDAIMGSGKTYDAIQRMKKCLDQGQKFIYITPFKSEIERVKKSLSSNEVYAPLGTDELGSGKYEISDNVIDEKGNIDLNIDKSYKYLNKKVSVFKNGIRREEHNFYSCIIYEFEKRRFQFVSRLYFDFG